MLTFSEENPSINSGLPPQMASNPDPWRFLVVGMDKQYNKQSMGQWFQTPLCSSDVTYLKWSYPGPNASHVKKQVPVNWFFEQT